MRKKYSLILVLTLVSFLSLYSFVSIMQQSGTENREEVTVYSLEQKNNYNTELTLVRFILNGVEQVFKVF